MHMTRRPRIVLPGWVHHVTQRGNHRQIVFYSDRDRIVYLQLAEKYFQIYELDLIGHSLMDNHVHLAVIPEKESSLSDGIGRLHHDFSRYQNIQRERTGHLWQGRFHSCPVEENRVWQVLQYIELNPVRAGMVKNAWEWKWSSAQAHISGQDRGGLLNIGYWEKITDKNKWKELLEKTAVEEAVQAQIRRTTMQGFFLGDETTARRLELELGIQLLPRKRGRKPR
jgi:putative transposase